MDAPWVRDAWAPTAGVFPDFPDWNKPSQKVFAEAKSQLVSSTKNIRGQPYEPKFWFERGQSLHDLGYPEVAAGDFEKTLMLIEYGLDFSSILGEKVRARGVKQCAKKHVSPHQRLVRFKSNHKQPKLSAEEVQKLVTTSLIELRRTTYLAYNDSMYLLRALPDMVALCKEAVVNHPTDPEIKETLEDVQDAHDQHARQAQSLLMAQGMTIDQYAWGMVATRLYPWIPKDLRLRDAETITAANKMLESCSDCLEIRPSTLGTDCFGMFARRDISKNEMILDSVCATGVSTQPVGGQYCYNCAAKLGGKESSLAFDCCPTMQFCSWPCRAIVDTTYHEVICGKDFSKLYEDARINDFRNSAVARDALLYLRLIAGSVQDGTHPLNTPPTSWIGANYESTAPSPWARDANIIGPIKVLQTLGIDIFAAEEHDTWVLQEIWNRASNNSRTHTNVLRQKIVHPLFSFFNHSCEPSTLDQTEVDPTAPKTSRSVMIATKSIKAGEEVCSTYLTPNYLAHPKIVRSQQLFQGGWFGPKGCRCKKCT